MITAIYPGSFDPITNGHIDIIRRATSIADKLIVAVAADITKKPLFSVEERVNMVENDVSTLQNNANIEVCGFHGLLVNFAKERDSTVIIRGLRAVSDFEYELQMANVNQKINTNIQTIFLPAAENSQFIASSMVKEVARLDGDVSKFVSPHVKEMLINVKNQRN